jgi:hypothetical protein
LGEFNVAKRSFRRLGLDTRETVEAWEPPLRARMGEVIDLTAEVARKWLIAQV